jgi:hypothetical protein
MDLLVNLVATALRPRWFPLLPGAAAPGWDLEGWLNYLWEPGLVALRGSARTRGREMKGGILLI